MKQQVQYNTQFLNYLRLNEGNLQSLMFSYEIYKWFNNINKSGNFSMNAPQFKLQLKKLVVEDIVNSIMKMWDLRPQRTQVTVQTMIRKLSQINPSINVSDLNSQIIEIVKELPNIQTARDKAAAHTDYSEESFTINIAAIESIIQNSIQIINAVREFFSLSAFERNTEIESLHRSFTNLNKA